MNQVATEFLNRCFAPGETVALLLRSDNCKSPTQRVVALERVLSPRYLGWLGHENAAGANVYVTANPLRLGSRKRTKENVACIRHLYIDIDVDGEVRLAALQSSDAVPAPSAVVSTSPGKYQVLWRVEGFDFALQEQMLKVLAIAFGGDPACTDRNRVLRVPGFLNHKYQPAHSVTVQYPDDSVWTPLDFRVDIAALDPLIREPTPMLRKSGGKRSNSECDWAWVCGQLAQGKDAVKLTRELASRRTDKSTPVYYAQRTVDVASARIWLSDGIGIDDVITMLEVRRRFEIPAMLCSARAREIALTAQRMMAVRKTA